MLSFPILFLKVAKVFGLALVFGLFAQFGPRFSIACGIETCIKIHLLAMQLEVSACVIETNSLETSLSGTSPFLAL